MKRGRPGTVGTADNTSGFQLVKFRLCLLEAEGIKPASFSKNRRTGGVDVVLNTMVRRKSF